MPNPENIKKHQFKKGESGNPKGRPPILPDLKEAIAKCLANEKDGKTALEKVLDALYAKALKGDVRAAQELLDRGFGKSTNTTKIEGDPITGITVEIVERNDKKSDSKA